MQRKTKRNLWIVIGAILGVLALFAWGAASLSSEHPDYLRAAKRLSAARTAAEERYGPLDKTEYQKLHGTTTLDDRAKWAMIEDSAPHVITDQLTNVGTIPDCKKAFAGGRGWFLALEKRTESLTVEDLFRSNGGAWGFPDYAPIKQLVKICRVGIIGAAESHDADALLKIGRAGNALTSKTLKEPDIVGALVAHALASIMRDGVLTAIVRARFDADVVRAAQSVLAEIPANPSIRKIAGIEARSTLIDLQELRTLDVMRLNEALDSLGGDSFIPPPSGPSKLVLGLLEKIGFENKRNNRRAGPHTVDALEARWLETLLLMEEACQEAETDYSAGRGMIEGLRRRVASEHDRSYELAFSFGPVTFIDLYLRQDFEVDCAKTCAALVARFPKREDLPASLPPDLVVRDPYSGSAAKYSLTADGFVLYSLGVNGKEDRFLDVSQLFSDPRAKFVKSGDDWGVVVHY